MPYFTFNTYSFPILSKLLENLTFCEPVVYTNVRKSENIYSVYFCFSGLAQQATGLCFSGLAQQATGLQLKTSPT